MTPWLLVSGDFTRLGGMDRANHALASFLARRGTPLHLVAHRVSDDLAALPNVTVHAVRRPGGRHLAGFPLLAARARRVASRLGPGSRVLANGGNASFPSPVWIHYLHAAFAPAPARSFRSRVATAVSGAYFRRQERRAVTRAPLLICNSERTARDVRERYNVAAARTTVVYYGTDDEFDVATAADRSASRSRLGIADDARVALFVGALADRRKGFDLLFEVWRRLCADPGWDVDLLVAGAGAVRDRWPAEANRARLGSRVRILGFRDDLASVLAAADLVVHPARYEAYGLGVHESLCRGIPAVVTTTAGVAERFPSEMRALLLPDPPASESLIRALIAWRRDADEWSRKAQTASAVIRQRRWDDMALDIVRAVESL